MPEELKEPDAVKAEANGVTPSIETAVRAPRERTNGLMRNAKIALGLVLSAGAGGGAVATWYESRESASEPVAMPIVREAAPQAREFTPPTSEIFETFSRSHAIENRRITFRLPPGIEAGTHVSVFLEGPRSPEQICVDGQLWETVDGYAFNVPADIQNGSTIGLQLARRHPARGPLVKDAPGDLAENPGAASAKERLSVVVK